MREINYQCFKRQLLFTRWFRRHRSATVIQQAAVMQRIIARYPDYHYHGDLERLRSFMQRGEQ